MLEQIFVILTGSYVSARLAVMLEEFMQYGNIFDFVKLYFSKKINKDAFDDTLDETKHMPISETYRHYEGYEDAEQLIIGLYDYNQKESKLFRLLNCPYCLSIWISFIVSAFAICCFGASLLALLFIPIIGYHLIKYL